MNLLNKRMMDIVIEKFNEISKNYLIELISYTYEKDHVHFNFKAQPRSEISKFINAYKSASSRILRKEFPEIKDLTSDGLWEKTYFLITEGAPNKDKIMHHLKNKIKCENVNHTCENCE